MTIRDFEEANQSYEASKARAQHIDTQRISVKVEGQTDAFNYALLGVIRSRWDELSKEALDILDDRRKREARSATNDLERIKGLIGAILDVRSKGNR